jgi:hypothetical protein
MVEVALSEARSPFSRHQKPGSKAKSESRASPEFLSTEGWNGSSHSEQSQACRHLQHHRKPQMRGREDPSLHVATIEI